MSKEKPTFDGLRVLVCGSTNFEDRRFVFGMLQGFAASFDISAVMSGPFSGSDSITREWCSENGVRYEPVNIAQGDRLDLAFFDDRKIPQAIMENDPVMRKGFEKLRDSGASVMLLIPRPDGQLGATCSCLRRMAEMVEIPVINGAEALMEISQRMRQACPAEPDASQEAAKPTASRLAR
jgi:hypothetical protein